MTLEEPDFELKARSSPPELELTYHTCATCGLRLPINISICPDDGTNLTSALGERLSADYEFLEEIGSGGMGVVYKARHRLLKQTVAIKTLRATITSQTELRRFEQEAKLISSLTHHGIVHLRDFGTTESGKLHMVLDYVAGQSLADAIKWQGTLSVADTLDIVIQVCDAMRYAHKQGILHRDIKPSNIMFERTDDGLDVKILDFGIAKILDVSSHELASLTKTGELLGSPLYMSPEQASGKKLDARSDIYSLGIVMYEMLSGHPPFASLNTIDPISSQINLQVPTLRTIDKAIPPEIDAAVAKAVAKNPESRFQSMDDFKRTLTDIKSGKGTSLLNEADAEDKQKLEIRKFEFTLVLVSICLIVFSIGLLAIFLTRKEDSSVTDKPLPDVSPFSDADDAVGTKSSQEARANVIAKEYIRKHKGDKSIDLSHLALTDAAMTPFTECRVTEKIILRGAKLTGPGLAYLIHLPLRQLDLYGCSIGDRSLFEIRNMKHLQELNLSHTDISDGGLAQLVGLLDLKRLSLKDVPVTDRGVAALTKVKTLECLNLKYNSLITEKGKEVEG
ncbi:MAG: protein kinase [Candidatus Melainabacteria bacterium]|nr:protein kinase [Candidatus Melainabacteria bacterium]